MGGTDSGLEIELNEHEQMAQARGRLISVASAVAYPKIYRCTRCVAMPYLASETTVTSRCCLDIQPH
jgi:hypothetical protein